MSTLKKRVLLAPLDWGLGHASRCIPIIKQLQSKDIEVIIAADRQPLKLLREAFPKLEFVRLRGMDVKYPKKLPMSLFMALSAPKFFETIDFEHQVLQDIVENYQIDGVISDNRYGLYHPDIPSVLITHQLFIQAPFLKSILKKLTERYAEKFNCCWVPDFPDSPNLSGQLSHQESPLNNVRFVGPLSRFSEYKNNHSNKKKGRDLMVILSGPEPSRSEFEKRLLPQLEKMKVEVLLVRGLVGQKEHTQALEKGKVEVVNHLGSREMFQEIQSSELILCRSGYSSVMDLAALGKKALLVPTPGQTEQEYLAAYLSSNQWFYSCSQEELDLSADMNKALSFKGFPRKWDSSQLSQAVEDFILQLNQ
ncbi:MAG: glycosyltransferase [Vicingaceae bacterium]